MDRRRAYGVTGGLAAAGLLLAGAGAAPAQESGGLMAELSFSQRITEEDDALSTTTALGLGLTSRTRRDRFEFSLQGGYEQSLESGGGGDLTDPSLRLVYAREGRSSALETSLRYRRRDVDSTVEDDDFGSGLLRLDQGTIDEYAAALTLTLGQDAPFGAVLDLGYEAELYTDTTDPDLIDEETLRAGLELRFELQPGVVAGLRAAVSDTDRDAPGEDVRREEIGASLSLAVSRTLTADLYLGHTRIVESGPLPTTTEDGLTTRLAFSQAQRNGVLTGSFESDIDEAGQRSTLRLGRSLEFRAATLEAGLGLSDGADGDLQPLLSLGYVQDLPHGNLSVRFDQNYSTSSDASEALNTSLRIAYRHDLTRQARLNASLGLRETDYLSGSTEDTRKVDLDLAYRHSLAQDWDFVGGYSHSISRTGSGARTHSDEIFLGLEKSVRWRF